MNTSVMKKAHQFLVHKGKADPNPYGFARYLKQIWFGLYSRAKGIPGSSGFEHVFLGELKNGVTGLHSWVQYSLEERKGNVNYLGYLDVVRVGQDYLIELPIYWRRIFKEISSIFVGTSPELEIALYTVCFTLMPDKRCPVDRTGHKPVFIQSYKTVYEGNTYIGTAYPTL